MQVIKPQRLGFLCRTVTVEGRRHQLVVTGMVVIPFDEPRALGMEVALWKDVAEHVPGGLLDEVYAKCRAEVLMHGHAKTVGEEPQPAVMTRLSVSRDESMLLDKQLAVFGNRVWLDDKPSEPVPFISKPMDWSRSFGGDGYAHNPSGKGASEVSTKHGKMWPLPNIENPDALVTSRDDAPVPAGYGALDISWPQRMDLVGKKYGKAWLSERFPAPAEDFNPRFYNVASGDQQFEGCFAGNEMIRMEGMHQDGPLELRLDPLVMKVMVTQACSAGAYEANVLSGYTQPLDTRFTSHTLALETVHVLPNVKRAILIYRNTIDVVDGEADDIVHLMVAAEDPSHPKTIEHYEKVLEGRLDKERGVILALNDKDLMPPAAAGWLCNPDYRELGADAVSGRALNRAEKARKARLAEVQAELEAAGFDVAEHFDPPMAVDAVDPTEPDALLLTMAQMQAIAAKVEARAEAEQQRLEKDARASFAAAGMDYDAEMAKAASLAAGPLDYSADEHLVTLMDMARIADEADVPMLELERRLLDPHYRQKFQDMEERSKEGYRLAADLMPAAAAPDEAVRQQLRIVVMAAKDSDTSLAGRELTGADLSRLDLSHIDLSGAMLEGADLSNANLYRANLAGAVLTRANLTDADLSGCNLTGTNLGDCQLSGTNLSEAVALDAVFRRSQLSAVRAQGARFNGCDFLETTFEDTDFAFTQCTGATFLKSDMRGVNFAGANLHGASFIQVDLRGVMFAGANLDEARFVQCNGDGAIFSGATLVGASFTHECSFADAIFATADLTRSTLHKCPLQRADFSGSLMNEANFIKANLTDANLQQVVAHKAMLMRGCFRGADLRGADLLESLAARADFRGADLRGANLSRSDVSLAHFDEKTRVDNVLLLDTRVDPRRQAPSEGRAL